MIIYVVSKFDAEYETTTMVKASKAKQLAKEWIKITRSRAVERFNLSAGYGWIITLLFSLIFTITFIVPMFRLIIWVNQAWSPTVLNQ